MALPFHRGALVPFLLAALGLAPPALRAEGESDLPPLDAAGRADAAARATFAEALPATEVGPYRAFAELGAGGMGVVHVAEATGGVRRRVALKRVRGAFPSAAQQAQFAVEVEALANLEHEHIVRLYDAGTTADGAPWLAMELIDGEPLTQYCERRGLGLDARLALLADVARAVAYMHTRGIVHGDLKPKNILVCERDGRSVVKVIDLGSARIAGQDDHAPRALMGTLVYMAPELLESEVAVDDATAATTLRGASGHALQRAAERSDVYALGIVLRELLLGDERDELAGAGWLALALSRATEPLPSPSAVLATRARHGVRSRVVSRGLDVRDVRRRLARGLGALMERATAFDARQRTESAAELATALERDVTRAARDAAWRRRACEWGVAATLGAAVGWLVG
jgi:serine/threonine protein kinase